MTTAFSLELHCRRFRSDVTVLFLRDLSTTTRASLANPMRTRGMRDEKFSVLEEVFRGGMGFDHIVHYEDFVLSPRSVMTLFDRLGWHLGFDALLVGGRSARSKRRMLLHVEASKPVKYGPGNLRTAGVLATAWFSKPGQECRSAEARPSLFQHYAAERKAVTICGTCRSSTSVLLPWADPA